MVLRICCPCVSVYLHGIVCYAFVNHLTLPVCESFHVQLFIFWFCFVCVFQFSVSYFWITTVARGACFQVKPNPAKVCASFSKLPPEALYCLKQACRSATPIIGFAKSLSMPRVMWSRVKRNLKHKKLEPPHVNNRTSILCMRTPAYATQQKHALNTQHENNDTTIQLVKQGPSNTHTHTLELYTNYNYINQKPLPIWHQNSTHIPNYMFR